MDISLYRAVMDGKVDILQQTQYIEDLDVHFNDSVLHVATQFGHLECVKEILNKCPSLLRHKNSKGETALYIAAREGHHSIVQELVEFAKKLDQEIESGGGAAKEMLRALNEDNDTALHMAARYGHFEVVRLLTSEDPEFPHPVNKAEETPLYLAVERGFGDVVSHILKTCKAPICGGPGGITVLQAAITSKSTECTRSLLHWNQDLIKKGDAYGWTPLHYAARVNNVQGVKQILEKDKSVVAIKANNDGGKAALHIAAAFGHIKVIEELLSHCPNCWSMVNNNRQNVLHIAVDMEREKVVRFILGKPWISLLINQKDIEGNTPLHLLAASRLSVSDLRHHSNADRYAFNNKNMTPYELFNMTKKGLTYGFGSDAPPHVRNIVSHDQENIGKIKDSIRTEQIEKARAEARDKARAVAEAEAKAKLAAEERRIAGTHVIVATLILTITFTAAFTVPGGYDGNQGRNQGMAILVRQAAFKAFVITNAIALICSASLVFLYVIASLYDLGKRDDMRGIRYVAALYLILVAMAAMMVAFVTGTYAMLAHSSGLAIATCALGCIYFVIYFFDIHRLFYNAHRFGG